MMRCMLQRLLQRMFVGPWSATTLIDAESGAVPTLTPLTALRYTPVYRAVTLISSDVARLSSTVSSSAADSLWRSPSTLTSAYEFRRAMTLQACLWGNAFAAINRTRGGELLELIMLDPESTSLDLTGDRPVYRTSAYGTIQLQDMLHIRAPGTNGLWGESPVRLCRTAMSVMAAQEQMALKAYTNAGNPKIALVHPGRLSPEAMQKIMADYEARHAGSINTGRPLVLAEGMKVERISSTLDDTGLGEARNFSVQEVSRIYGVPVSMLSGESGAGYGTMEWLSRMYVDACLQHWLHAWQVEVLLKLASPFDSMTWDLDALIRPGIAEQMAALRTGVEAGFLTRNEARAKLDLPPLPGLDEPTLALNVGTGGGQTNIGTDTSEQEGTPNDF